jgi:hypothetical protein
VPEHQTTRTVAAPRVVYVDIDDTLIRSVGTKRIPMSAVIATVRRMHAGGAQMYCWSTGGADYAREVATQLGIASLFLTFLPKPHIMIDDQLPQEWRSCSHLHPMNCSDDAAANSA